MRLSQMVFQRRACITGTFLTLFHHVGDPPLEKNRFFMPVLPGVCSYRQKGDFLLAPTKLESSHGGVPAVLGLLLQGEFDGVYKNSGKGLPMRHVAQVIVLVVLIIVPLACTPVSKSSPRSIKAVCPPAVELSLGKGDFVKVQPWVSGDEFCLASGPDGRIWLLLTASQCLYYAVRQDGSWSEVKAMPTDGWAFINQLTAAVDKAGQPVVIWSGFDATPGEALGASHWLGSSWGRPQLLDRLETCTSIENLCSLRDNTGNVHIAYDRPLKQRESYNLGGHGMFPSKCWHAVFDGSRWSKPGATSGKGLFSAKALGLSRGSDGCIVLAVHSSPPSDAGYIGEQTWDGSAWSSIKKLKDGARGGMAATPWGDRLVWWSKDQRSGASLMRGNREAAVPSVFVGESFPVAQDQAGRLALYQRGTNGGKIQVWNGNRWSGDIECGLVTRLIATMDGNLIAARFERDGVWLQDILVRELEGDAVENQPGETFAEPR